MAQATDNIVFSIVARKHPSDVKPSAIGKLMNQITDDDFEYTPFGEERYGGQFSLRYPNLGDRNKILGIMTSTLVKAGFADIRNAPPTIQSQEYGFAVLDVVTIEKPEWADRAVLSTSIDSLAIAEVGICFNEAVEAQKKRFSKTSKQ